MACPHRDCECDECSTGAEVAVQMGHEQGIASERERVRGVLREMLADWPQWGEAYDAVNYIAEQLGISLDGGER